MIDSSCTRLTCEELIERESNHRAFPRRMAPGKKKKKPASNPARGFATTSTVSKSKQHDSDEVVLEPHPTGLNSEDGKLMKDVSICALTISVKFCTFFCNIFKRDLSLSMASIFAKNDLAGLLCALYLLARSYMAQCPCSRFCPWLFACTFVVLQVRVDYHAASSSLPRAWNFSSKDTLTHY